MKRWGLLLSLLLFGAMIAWAGWEKHEEKFTLTITGSASGNDSIIADTIYLDFDGKNKFNSIYGTVNWDSVKTHNPTGSMKACSVMTVLKSYYAGLYHTLDSTKGVLAAAATVTHNFVDGRDTLHGEKYMLILRLADTVGVETDSVATITGRVQLLHKY